MQVFNYLFLLQLLLISIINTTFPMKLKMYNIRSLNRPQLFPQENLRSHNSIEPKHSQHLNTISQAAHVPQENQFNQLVSMFQTFLKSSEKKPETDPKRIYEVQARDREVIIPLPDTSNKIPPAQLKLWIANVVKTICSSAFNYFYKRQMNYEQAKIFCSQNIFKNIVTLSQTYNLSPSEMQQIDSHIKKGVLTYLGTKYPLTDSTQINKKLEEAIHEIDNSQALANNYFANTNIVFEYRESGNYNDLIMLVINDLMRIIDDENSDEKSNFQDFEEFMSTSVFEKVEDEDWMRKQEKDQIFHHLKLAHQQSEVSSPLHHHKQQEEGESINKEELQDLKERLRRRNEEKEKYKNKVKEYTHYLIGRKIPENTPTFTDVEIENGNINIKSPTILRILTKWCGQLKEKYSDSYYSNRSESVKLQKGGNVNSLLAWMRKSIDDKLEAELKDIDRTMAEIFKNNYEMQSKILQNEILTKGDQFIDPIEKISGKFSYKVVKNLHSYIITYLNRLIHGLLKASKEFFIESNIFDYSLWPCPPNLLTFKIGDLMRCKCSSKEKEILRIYKELHRISRQNPEKLKIIRVKNRLRSGTNDILMNIRFNDQITCEIQLAIKSKVSDFIKCSNLFHHYLYELERSVFGPLTELSSIWNSLDRRTDVYHELVDQQQFSVASHDHTCAKLKKKFQMKNYDKPFVCNSCNQTYFHNNYLRHHIKCTLCAYIICAKCRINQESDTSLKNTLIDSVEIRNACNARVSPDSELPAMGVCVYIESKEPKYEIFTLITYQNKKYLLGRKDDEIYEIYKINSKKKYKNFKKKFIIFQLSQNTVFTKIEQKQARNKYILPVMMKQNFKKEKESFNLMDLQLTTEECRQILSVGTKSQKQNVKNLFLVDNVIEQIPFNPEEFPNIRWLTLSRNIMKSFKGLSQLHNLKNIICVSCELPEISEDIYQTTSLEQLSLPYNQITTFDERIVNLNRLISFQLSGNLLIHVPQSLYQCISLKKLKLDNNSLTEIPDGIAKLVNLEVMMYSGNQICSITEKIGELSQLREIYLAKNYSIDVIPASFSRLAKIEMIDLAGLSALKEIPIPQTGWPNLKLCKIEGTSINKLSQLHLVSKKLEILIINSVSNFEFPSSVKYQSIKNFEAQSMGWQSFPSVISQMTNLQTLSIENNPFKDTIALDKLCNLENLNLKDCYIQQLPILICKSLKKIDISSNKISSITNQSIEDLLALEDFTCTNNALTLLPSCMIRMTNLNRLDIKDNAFVTLFDAETEEKIENEKIGWPHLKYVYIASSKLQDIPLILCYSPKILDLFINQNQLKRIRPEVKNIIGLKQMQFTGNQITEIPIQVSEFTNLTGIYLSNNLITKIPSFVQNIKTLQGFYVDNNDIKEVECFDWIEDSGVNFSTLRDIAYKLKNGKDRYADYYNYGGENVENPVENQQEKQQENHQENNQENNEDNNEENNEDRQDENNEASVWNNEQLPNKPEENIDP